VSVSLFATAAVCNLGDAGKIEISDTTGKIDQAEENTAIDNEGSNNNDNQDADSSANEPGTPESDDWVSNESSSGSSSSNNSGSNNSPDNNPDGKAPGENNPPVINNVTFSSDTFLPNQDYTLSCDVSDPDNDQIFYDWHVESGWLNNPESSSPVWTTPDFEGIVDVELMVSDGWGGSDTFIKTITLGSLPSNASPIINEIAVYPDGPKYTNNTYKIWCDVDDPNNSLRSFDFTVSGGFIYDQSANIIYWDTPDNPGSYDISVSATDKEGNVATASHSVTVEQERIEVSDIEVLIDVIYTDSTYNVKATVIDPKQQVMDYQWDSSGGNLIDQVGRLIAWETPSQPGTYSLTLTIKTFSGDTYSRTEDFVVNQSK